MRPASSPSRPARLPERSKAPPPPLGAKRAPLGRDAAATLRWLGAVAFAAAGLVHIGLLAYIFATRLTAPFDLEWMEGGMLTHALRIMHGEGVYVQPSSEFISYLYTPGYPALVAAFGKLFGVSYTLGRLISVAAFAGVCALAYRVVAYHVERSLSGPRWEARFWAIGVVGLLCASFQHTGAWYDLVRNDSLYLLLVIAGVVLLFYRHKSWPHLIAASMLLGLGFLTKQTTALFIVFSGFAVMALCWRRLPVHVLIVGAVAGGSTLLLEALSRGWFWEYIYKLHQGHDVYWDRMLETTPKILAKATPVVAVIFCVGLL
ncbi:MAG: hypothetical protein KC503_21625, partial [Myxococcales bacterium]|nr:hypothetical protein [Myxococcales bacterium]